MPNAQGQFPAARPRLWGVVDVVVVVVVSCEARQDNLYGLQRSRPFAPLKFVRAKFELKYHLCSFWQKHTIDGVVRHEFHVAARKCLAIFTQTTDYETVQPMTELRLVSSPDTSNR